MNMLHFVIVKHNTGYFRPVVAVNYADSRIRLGRPSDDGLPFSLEEAKALQRRLTFYGYEALVWSTKGV